MTDTTNGGAGTVFPDGASTDLFAGVSVTDYVAAVAWYEQLFGCPPTFLPNDREAVWGLAAQRYLFIELLPEHAGHARHLIFLHDLDGFVAQVGARGVQPTQRETLENGVRKVIYHDPDGNKIEFGGAPAEA